MPYRRADSFRPSSRMMRLITPGWLSSRPFHLLEDLQAIAD